LDDRQQLSDIGQHRLPVVVGGGARRGRGSPESDELLREGGVLDLAGCHSSRGGGVGGGPRRLLVADDGEKLRL
jgi:hypothetical protein